jgi:germination protein M
VRACALVFAAAALVAGCFHQNRPAPSPQVTVYFCRAGTDTLVPTQFSANPRLKGAQLETALVAQLLAGAGSDQNTVVLFPAGTKADVTVDGPVATVNFTGTLSKPFRGGASDEIALFKSLAYTVTSVPGVTAVQVLINGRKLATLPGGEFEIDEPLTRETFAQ